MVFFFLLFQPLVLNMAWFDDDDDDESNGMACIKVFYIANDKKMPSWSLGLIDLCCLRLFRPSH